MTKIAFFSGATMGVEYIIIGSVFMLWLGTRVFVGYFLLIVKTSSNERLWGFFEDPNKRRLQRAALIELIGRRQDLTKALPILLDLMCHQNKWYRLMGHNHCQAIAPMLIEDIDYSHKNPSPEAIEQLQALADELRASGRYVPYSCY